MAKVPSLGRPATGLPRYYMDCGWYRHHKYRGLPIEALFLFEAGVGYCTQHATDGVMSADPEDLSLEVGVRLAVVRKGLAALVDRGIWVRAGGEVSFPDWGEHNPTKEEIEELSESRSKSGSWGNHVRHHLKKGVAKPDCEHCQDGSQPVASGSQVRSQEGVAPPRNPDRKSSQTSSHGMGWEEKTPPQPPLGDDRPMSKPSRGGSSIGRTVTVAAGLCAKADLARLPSPPEVIGAWLTSATRNIAEQAGPGWRARLATDPDLTADDLAAGGHWPLAPTTNGTPVPPLPPRHDPDCARCDGAGWLLDDAGNASERCDCRTPGATAPAPIPAFGAST